MTKKEIYKQVFDILAQKRNEKIYRAEQNRLIAESNQEYINCVQRERILNLEIGKLKFENKDISKKQKELNEVLNKKESILNAMGLTKDDIQPQYDCKKCLDTGIFENGICSCANQIANNILMKKCGVDLSKVPSFEEYDYKFFDSEDERTFAQKCVKTLDEYVNKFEKIEIRNIVMCGASGTGKTYLTKCIAKEMISRGHTTLFASAFDLNNLFLEEHLSQSDQKDHLQDLIDLDVLIIDDIGTEPMRRNVTKEYLLLLLNERLAKGKATIITSNLNPEQMLAKYEERIFSRMFNKRTSLVLEFKGKNNRLKK